MGVQDIVNLQITLRSSAPTKQGFGRPAIGGYFSTSIFPERSRLYRQPANMLTDGFAQDDQVYKLAQSVCSQNQRPKDFKILRFAHAYSQIIELVPLASGASIATGFRYFGTIGGLAWEYVVLGGDALDEIVDGITAAVDALAGVSAVSDGTTASTKTTVSTTAAGSVLTYTACPEIHIKDVTADAGGASGVADDLAACWAADKDWFGLLLAQSGAAQLAAAAAWIEDKRRILVYTTADFGAKDPTNTTTDIMSVLKGLAYFNTGGWYMPTVGSLLAAAILGQRLTAQPGSDTWAHKTVRGVTAATELELTAAQEVAVLAKNGNTYTNVAGSGRTFEGKVAGGDYFDVVRYIHFLFARLQEAVIFLFQSTEKVPFTNPGAQSIGGAIEAVLQGHTRPPFNALVIGSVHVEVPDVTDPEQVDASDKATRHLPNVTFGAQLTGAIHAVDISGTVST